MKFSEIMEAIKALNTEIKEAEERQSAEIDRYYATFEGLTLKEKIAQKKSNPEAETEHMQKIKKYQETIRKAEKTISDNHEKIQDKDKIIDNISKKIEDLESIKTNASFDEAYKSFCDSYIFKKIKSLMDGRIILIKNIQENSKLALSNNDIISLVKTFNKYFPNTISSLKKDYEGITSNDSKFFILSFMNFNDIEIAVLLGLTYSASNKRSKKIKDIFNIKSDLSDFVFQYTKSKF